MAAAKIKIILDSVNDAAHQGIGPDLEQRGVVIFRSPAEPVVTSNSCRKPDKLWMFQPVEWETFVRIDARPAKSRPVSKICTVDICFLIVLTLVGSVPSNTIPLYAR